VWEFRSSASHVDVAAARVPVFRAEITLTLTERHDAKQNVIPSINSFRLTKLRGMSP
jgi:hypothetical protein